MTLLSARGAWALGESRHIWLQSGVFDPLTDPPVPPDLAGFPTTLVPCTSDWFLMQSWGTQDAAWRAAIAARGGEALDALRSGASIVRAATGQRVTFDDVPTRRATVDYLPAHRLTRSAIIAWQHPETTASYEDGQHHIDLILMPWEDPATLVGDLLNRIGNGVTLIYSSAPDRTRLRRGTVTLGVGTTSGLVAAIEESARTPGVEVVTVGGGPTLGSDPNLNGIHQTDLPDITSAPLPPAERDYLRSARLFQHGINGVGETLAIADSPNTRTQHCALRFDVNDPDAVAPPTTAASGTAPLPVYVPDRDRKIVAHYQDWVQPQVDSLHGTFMSLIAAGDVGLNANPSLAPCLAKDDDPWAPGDCGLPRGVEHEGGFEGTAPGCRLVMQDNGDLVLWPPGVPLIHAQAYDTIPFQGSEGARIYQSARQEYDAGPPGQSLPVYAYTPIEEAIDAESWLRRDYNIVVSAGNNDFNVRYVAHSHQERHRGRRSRGRSQVRRSDAHADLVPGEQP